MKVETIVDFYNHVLQAEDGDYMTIACEYGHKGHARLYRRSDVNEWTDCSVNRKSGYYATWEIDLLTDPCDVVWIS